MKKYLLSLLVVGLIFIGFSNGQFVGPVQCDKYGCLNVGCDYCPVPSDSGEVWCEGDGEMAVIRRQKVDGALRFSGKSCPYRESIDNVNYTIVGVASVQGTVKAYYNGKTSKMPVSELSPVITGLSNSIEEFIPYVVFIGIGVLSSLLGFYAIRWFINWVRGKSLGSFSSGRRK